MRSARSSTRPLSNAHSRAYPRAGGCGVRCGAAVVIMVPGGAVVTDVFGRVRGLYDRLRRSHSHTGLVVLSNGVDATPQLECRARLCDIR